MAFPLYPFRFLPLFKRYLWGGRRLGAVLGKPIGSEDDYAESWEVADHHQGQSVVANGPLAGITLHQLVQERGDELLGRHAPQSRFPLIFKYLDCQRDLSVQVHPNDAAATRLDPPDLGKTEAWFIVDARPGSRIYAGLKSRLDRQTLQREVLAGRTAECLHSFEASAGQCVIVPAGTVHALGAGLLVAEIQQASDTTYRLFDWNRVGPDGQPRKLHVEEALDAIDYSAGPVIAQQPKSTDRPHVQRLVACDKFILDQWSLASSQSLAGDGRFHIISVLEGEVGLDDVALPTLKRGQTAVIPASLPPLAVAPRKRAVLLDMYLP
jgi:mannose-6-phosphate isomerase